MRKALSYGQWVSVAGCDDCPYCNHIAYPHTGLWCTHQLIPARLGDKAPDGMPDWCPLLGEDKAPPLERVGDE